ncbi:hypothetical protein pEaSNUABM9_00138 [Erwinia phage pEa_SNUABM_9]|nr:hypothetical protein pEaSNUABM9_00138 [Erwinia phage pEa_SNUABM_9]
MRTGRRYLVCVDTIFDTRVGWARVTHPKELAAFDLDVYRGRRSEYWAELAGIPGWDKHYMKRDKRALMNAEPTEFLYGLKNQLLADITQIQMSAPLEPPVLTINMWPYTDLTEEEAERFKAHFRMFYNEVKVEITFTPFGNLTIGHLNALWDTWYMYDWFRWIDIQAKNLEVKAPVFTIVIPALLVSDIPNSSADAIERDNVNPFLALTRFMEEIVTVDPVDARLFSIRRPRPQDAEKTPSS